MKEAEAAKVRSIPSVCPRLPCANHTGLDVIGLISDPQLVLAVGDFHSVNGLVRPGFHWLTIQAWMSSA